MKALVWLGMMGLAMVAAVRGQTPEALRHERDGLVERGLWREAVTFYGEKLAPLSDAESGVDLNKTVDAIGRLGAWVELDALVEAAISSHADNARLLQAAAGAYQGAPKNGRLIGGIFERDGQGPVAAEYRDRVRSLQLLVESLKFSADDAGKIEAWQRIEAVFPTQGYDAWKLQVLTPLDVLPEWGEPGPAGGSDGAPWTADGPVLYKIPVSWEAARNDGERWRFALSELAEFTPELAARSLLALARFSESQFGTDTLTAFDWWRNRDPENARGILALDTLADDEVLAKTADGVHRFTLPADSDFIALYRLVLDDEKLGGQAGDALAQVFIGRQQFAKAREALEQVIAKHGAGPADSRKLLLEQISGNWGRFGAAATVAEGVRPKVPLIFRNAKAIRLTAAPVDMDAVLADTVAFLKSNPREIEWEQINPSAIASRIIAEEKSKYVGEVAASWEQALTPKEEYRDTRTEVEVPVEKAGAWWVTAEMADGNRFSTLVWIVDDILVHRDVAGNKQWWTADAASGAPIAGTEIEFFGYQIINRERKTPLERRIDVETKSFTGRTDDEGKLVLKVGDLDTNFEWMAIAKKEDRATAFFGFQPFVIAGPEFENGNRDVGYGVTDRPLYQPGDALQVKFFLRNVGYFEPDEAKYANRTGTLSLFNGRGEEALKIEDLRTDELGAIESKAILPPDAPLGNWRAVFAIEGVISASVEFRVEEFRKPEYEVTVEAPAEPVKLGGKFSATVKAMYFHGAPVREAEVEILVKRSSLGERWFPAGRWDWLYGKGAWWPGTDAAWHPGWSDWSSGPEMMPNRPGGARRWTPEEVVLRKSVPIGADGTVKVEVDTAPALEIHGDLDAEYSIEARVVDASRREESGRGKVIAARKPFEVVVWADRGFARAGDEVAASISAATLDGKPVAGAAGTLKLLKLSVTADGKVEETEAGSWPVTTDAAGKISQRFPAPATGQYRFAASLALQDGAASAGATILDVFGNDGTAAATDWKFGALELLSDKLEYAAGDVMKLRVNSDQPDAHVWLFLHVGGSSGREARRIQLTGKSLEIEVPLDRRDMPNMFIEAVTVHGAQIHTASREVLLPPESQLIDVTVEPAKAKVTPRETSALKIHLQDAAGRPVVGKAVLSVYDKALEAITGGSNVPPIREAFWGWKNFYYGSRSSCSVPASPGNLIRPKTLGMETFGAMDMDSAVADGFGGGRAMRKGGMMMTLAAPAPAVPMEQKEMAAAAAAPEVVVRSEFADLLKWSGTITTDAAGNAEIPLEFPDNLTTWKARVWVVGSGTRVGEGSAEIIASKDLLVRLQAPRFLVEGDETVLSAVVHNDHETAKKVTISLELNGDAVKALDGKPAVVEIAARSETRVDWRVKALHEGVAKVRMRAETEGDGDAVERELPVMVHGMPRQDAWSRVVEPDAESAKISIAVPEKLRPEQKKLTVRFSPSVAGAVVDAIPYLADYPYGCTEQTLNRFVPAVVAQRLLKDMNVNLAEVKAKRTNLNPQELGDAADRATRWKQWQTNPVFDEAELAKMTAAGLEKLGSMQNSDGGWGWFSGYGEESYPHTTAVVVRGLLTGKAAGMAVPDELLDRGVAWLAGYEKQQVEALKRLAAREAEVRAGKEPVPATSPEKAKADAVDAMLREVLGAAGNDNAEMVELLFRDRTELPVYALALLGLELHRKEDAGRRDEVLAMISQFVQRDAENQTIHLDLKNDGYWWNWYGNDIEAHAWVLKLLTAVKPNDADTRGLVKYLVNHRQGGSFWSSTRDTAYAIEAIAGYAKASGEDAPEMEVEILLDGGSIGRTAINRDNLFSFDGTVSLAGKSISPGTHEIEIRRSDGKGAVYANAYLEVFTLEDRLRAAGLEVKVQRKVSKLTALSKDAKVPDAEGTPVAQTEERFKRTPLEDGAKLATGDRIEVELILESKNDYEYLLFSDAKAAGFEALEALSGYVRSGDAGLGVYMEPRNRTVDFFLRSLPRGTHSLRYQLRAEAPGIYQALPATAKAMYAPELRANSDDLQLEIRK
jgi:uncharacterized protein YfaS (alpha-2-macroglobulin family)